MKKSKKKKNNPKKHIKGLFYNLFWVIIKTYQGEQVQEADGGRRGYLKSESTRKARRLNGAG